MTLDELKAELAKVEGARRKLPRGQRRGTLWQQRKRLLRRIGEIHRRILMERSQAENRTCLECKQCYLDPGSEAWSEATPGSPMDFDCCKGHYHYDESTLDKQRLRSAIFLARTCGDFEVEPDRRYWEKG